MRKWYAEVGLETESSDPRDSPLSSSQEEDNLRRRSTKTNEQPATEPPCGHTNREGYLIVTGIRQRLPAKDRTEPHWVRDREGYLIEKGLRRRLWQRQHHQENDGVSTSSPYEPPDLIIIAGFGLQQRHRQEDDRGRGDLMDRFPLATCTVRLPFATRLAQGLISAREIAALDAADDAENGWMAGRRGRCRRGRGAPLAGTPPLACRVRDDLAASGSGDPQGQPETWRPPAAAIRRVSEASVAAAVEEP